MWFTIYDYSRTEQSIAAYLQKIEQPAFIKHESFNPFGYRLGNKYRLLVLKKI